MSGSETTCWTLIAGAAGGDQEQRAEFASRYEGGIRAYLAARWSQSTARQEVDDAVQEVFVECLKAGGVLERADQERPGGFRPFLYGVVRNVARRFEKRGATARREVRLHTDADPPNPDPDSDALTREFDRPWAQARLAEAAARHVEWSRRQGEAEERRVELLKLRFQNSLSMVEIAKRWDVSRAHVYREFDQARKEYRRILFDVVSFYRPGTRAEIEEECAILRSLVSAS